MQDQIAEVLFYLKGTLKYKWVAIICAWVVCIGGWTFVSSMPDKYTSEAKVHVETRTMLQPLVGSMIVMNDPRVLLRVMQQLMFTKENLEQIIKLSDLEKSKQAADDHQTLLETLKKDIKINGGADEIFNISYEADNPEKAKNIVQAVLTVFSEQTHKSTLAGADVAQKFIDEQIKDYESRLKNAEKAREEFKRSNLGLLPEQNGGSITAVQEVNKQLEEATLQLNEALSKKKVLQEQLNELKETGEDWAITELTTQGLPEEDERILALRARKKELLVKYLPTHPEVISLNKTIEEIKKNKKPVEKDPDDDMFSKPGVLANPYVQSIKVALNEADAQTAVAQSRVDQLMQRKSRIGEELNTRLSIETELQNLNRDYDAIKGNYSKLLESRETAKMSKDVDDQAESLKFKIADAPNTPLQPSSPKRKLLFSAVFVAGIILGFGMAFLLYFIRPTIMSTTQLRQLTGLPVLGSVSMKSTPERAAKYKKEVLKYSFSSFGLVVIYAGLMAVDALGIKSSSLTHLLQSIN